MGLPPTPMLATTLFVESEMTETLPVPTSVTNTSDLFGSKAIPPGMPVAETLAITVSLVSDMTDITSLKGLVTTTSPCGERCRCKRRTHPRARSGGPQSPQPCL